MALDDGVVEFGIEMSLEEGEGEFEGDLEEVSLVGY